MRSYRHLFLAQIKRLKVAGIIFTGKQKAYSSYGNVI